MKFKLYHDFLKHYSDGKNVIEEKPVIVTKIGKITKFEINYQNHSSFYNFYNLNWTLIFELDIGQRIQFKLNLLMIMFILLLENRY